MTAPPAEYPPSLAAALAQLQTKLPRISKSETAKVVSQKGSYSYSYAGLADISAQVLPLLGAVGLSFTAAPRFDESGRYVLACTLLHASGEKQDGAYLLPTSGTPQALGSAITYGRRYILCSMTGIAPDEDDDGAAAQAEAAQPKTAQRDRPAAQRGQAARPAQRARREAPAEPPLPGEDGASEPTRSTFGEQPAATRGVTPDQIKKLHAQLNELGVKERADKLTTVGMLAGRALNSSTDMTMREASKVIDTLEDVLGHIDPAEALDAALGRAQDQTDTAVESAAPAALVAKLKRQLADLQVKPGEHAAVLSQVAGRKIGGWSDLSTQEGARAADVFVQALKAEQPGRALDALLGELADTSRDES